MVKMYTGFKPKIDIQLQLSIIFTPKIFEAQIFTEYYPMCILCNFQCKF